MSDQNLDIIIRTQLEAAGFEATKQQIAEVKAAMEANGGMNLEALRGFSEGVEAHVQALLKRKEAVIDGAIGAKMQADAAVAEKALQQEIKALDAFEKKKQKEIEAFQATEKKRATEQATAKDEAARSKVLEELTRNVVKDTDETRTNTEAKRQQNQALMGLSRAFPGVTETIRAMLSPLGLMTAALGGAIALVRRSEQDFTAWSERMASVKRQVELLTLAQKSSAEIQAQAAKDYETLATSMLKAQTALDALTKAQDAQTASVVSNRQINEGLDDELLRAELLRINGLNEPESNKNLLRARATQAAAERKEQGRIAAQQADAQRTEQQAAEARDLAARKQAEAAGMTPEIARLTEASQTSSNEVKKREAESADLLSMLEKQIVNFQATIDRERPTKGSEFMGLESGGFGRVMSFDEMVARRDTLKEQAERLRGGVTEARGIASLDAENLAAAQKRQRGLLDEAAGANGRANQLGSVAAGQRTAAGEAQRGFELTGGIRASNNTTQNRQGFEAQYHKELVDRIREAQTGNQEMARLLIEYLQRTSGNTAEVRKLLEDLNEATKRNRPIQ